MDEFEKIKQRDNTSPETGEHKYGDVEFADPENKKYPIDTKEHVQAALRYIGMPKNRKKYDAKDLATIEGRIHAAARKFDIDSGEKKKSTDFNFFANLVKAYTDEDGNNYIIGEASGPELDQDGEKMAKSAIKCMMKCIHDKIVDDDGNLVNVPLNDAHYHDGVLKELGQIISAELTDKYHLLIKAVLDMDNPAAVSLLKQLRKGKQFGLSVAGIINDAKDVWDDVLEASVRQFTDVSLEEISVTSRPSWSESYVTVLTKSAKNYLTQDTTMKTTDTLPETAKAADTQETKNLVEETKKTESVTAEEKVKKAKDAIKPQYMEVMRKKVAHLHDHLASMAQGEVEPEEELDHVAGHAKSIASTLGKMSKGDCGDFDGMDLTSMSMTPRYMLSHREDETQKVEKSADETPATPEVPAEETIPVEQPETPIVGDTVPELPVETPEDATQTVATEESTEEKEAEPAAVEETEESTEKSVKADAPDIEALVKSAVEKASSPYLEEIKNLKAEVETLKKIPNDPKGKIKAEPTIDKSRVLGGDDTIDTQEARQARLEKAIADNPRLPMARALEILQGKDR